MDKNSNRATSFIAVAHYNGSENEVVKSAAFAPTSTIQDIFSAFWPAADDHAGIALANWRTGRLPLRIEIMPDANTIPVDKPLPVFGV
ncbi:MAG: hypothetical protein EOS10_31005 [Mesorhizobium sp.]|uniref:hypothetical protein n=1 Tax=Mesorhizobium sp. TaxID=1871066 RepID=UPI000FE89107|nr:hypothetical protein [Mesorhizobium sp.]RWO25252.1 MAG: hypothetical protein EOS10_31005 [Mesorhizobium sp.]